MKKFLILTAVVVLCYTTILAQKKVAVWETKCTDNSITSFQSTMVRGGMETAVGNTPGYEVYDRSAFDAIMKEHNFQRSGAVDDKQIRQLGVMAGVQYIIVPEATSYGSEFYILVKMLDVETGKFGAVYEELCGPSGSEIKEACSKLGEKLFGVSNDIGENGQSKTNNNTSGIVSTNTHDRDFTETAFSLNMRMIYVEGGTFTMGCTSEQGDDCNDDEKNVRRVTLDGFYIGMLEVTQSQWFNVMKDEPVYWGGDNSDMYSRYESLKEPWVSVHIYGDDEEDDWGKPGDTVISYGPMWFGQKLSRVGAGYPMYLVDYSDAEKFCEKLSAATGKKYVLPTEAQWEYAARGGNNPDRGKYSGSNKIDEVAWYDGNSGNSVHICGTRRPNSLGIYDMSGNVSEWCSDYYIESYLNYDTYNPSGPTEPDDCELGCKQVVRGGDWMYSNPQDCRVSNRSWCRGAYFSESLGFRVVCIQ